MRQVLLILSLFIHVKIPVLTLCQFLFHVPLPGPLVLLVPAIPVLEAAFALVAAYNYCWRTRKPGKSGQKRPTAAMMARLTGHVWSFDELFDAVLNPTV